MKTGTPPRNYFFKTSDWKKARNFLLDRRSLTFLDRMHSRLMAAEPRTRRRMLATALAGVLEAKLSSHGHAVRVAASNDPRDTCYVFLTLEPEPGDDEEEYRRKQDEAMLDKWK